MGKNYRQLVRTNEEKRSLQYGEWHGGNAARRRINRIRYQEQNYFKELVRDMHDMLEDVMVYQPDYVRYGKGLKLSSTRRFIDYHQRNNYY